MGAARILEQIGQEYERLSAGERNGITRTDLAWLDAILGWAMDAAPETRAELEHARALLALVSFWSWRPRLRLVKGGKA